MKKRATIVSELRELQVHYRFNQSQMAVQLNMSRGHYSEVLSGKRRLPYEALCLAYNLGAEADVLLSLDNFEKSPVNTPASAMVRRSRRANEKSPQESA